MPSHMQLALQVACLALGVLVIQCALLTHPQTAGYARSGQLVQYRCIGGGRTIMSHSNVYVDAYHVWALAEHVNSQLRKFKAGTQIIIEKAQQSLRRRQRFQIVAWDEGDYTYAATKCASQNNAPYKQEGSNAVSTHRTQRRNSKFSDSMAAQSLVNRSLKPRSAVDCNGKCVSFKKFNSSKEWHLRVAAQVNERMNRRLGKHE